MKRFIKYIIGFLIIVSGLTLKTCLNHNVNYWGIVKIISLLCFIIGIAAFVPLGSVESKSHGSSSEELLKKMKWVGIAVIMVIGIIGFEKLGVKMNYKLRNYYLSYNTGKAVGTIRGIKRIEIVRGGHADFYVIDFSISGNTYYGGLQVKYADEDNNYFDKFIHPKVVNGGLTVSILKGDFVNIVYSKKFPSFFKVQE